MENFFFVQCKVYTPASLPMKFYRLEGKSCKLTRFGNASNKIADANVLETEVFYLYTFGIERG